jgi:hypothetical protein
MSLHQAFPLCPLSTRIVYQCDRTSTGAYRPWSTHITTVPCFCPDQSLLSRRAGPQVSSPSRNHMEPKYVGAWPRTPAHHIRALKMKGAASKRHLHRHKTQLDALCKRGILCNAGPIPLCRVSLLFMQVPRRCASNAYITTKMSSSGHSFTEIALMCKMLPF